MRRSLSWSDMAILLLCYDGDPIIAQTVGPQRLSCHFPRIFSSRLFSGTYYSALITLGRFVRGLLILSDTRSLRRHWAPNQKNLYRQARTVHQSICAMAVIGLVAVGLLGCGFMIYVLVQWMQETLRKD